MSFFPTAGIRPSLSFEFFPPRDESGLEHVESQIVELAIAKPDLVTVTHGAAGGARTLSKKLVHYVATKTNLPICPHLTCAGHSRSELDDLIKEFQNDGIERVLALRGDPSAGETKFIPHPDGYSCARDLVKQISKTSKMKIAVAGYPEVHKEALSKDADLIYLKEKVDAGSSIVITQLFFDEDTYFQFVKDARTIGITVPILPGIMPISNASQLKRFTNLCGATIPERIVKQLADDPEGIVEFGIQEGIRLCTKLLEGGAPGIHLYTLNKTVQILPILNGLSKYYPR
jgi:methylenetetrahydrofolate reductase (NADPH)